MQTLYMITGATGHLGTTLVSQLLSKGNKVRILALPQDDNIPHGVQVCYGNVADRQCLAEFFADTDSYHTVLIHCAAIVTIANKVDSMLHNVNVLGTRNIVDMAIEHHIDKLIHVSSVHAIPEPDTDCHILETDTFDNSLVHGAYAKSKADATAYVLSRSADIDVSVVHPSGIIGPDDPKCGNLTKMISDYYSGKLTVGIAGGYDFVDVRDVANGIISCINKGKRGQCYILSNNYYSIKQLYQYIDSYLQRKKRTTIIPLWLARLVAPISEAMSKLFRRRTSFTQYSIYTLSAKSNFCHNKATQQLAYHPRHIANTICDTIAWLQRSTAKAS